MFNIGEGCDEALELWIEFSQRSDKFVPGGCEELWGKMEMKGKTIASLLAMAKKDSPNEYKEWRETQVKYFLYHALLEEKPNEWDLALVVEKMFGDRFVCADAKKDVWYEFKNHRFHLMDDGIEIKGLLPTEVRAQFFDLYEEIEREIFAMRSSMNNERRDESEMDREEAQRMDKLSRQKKRVKAILTALKTTAFHDKVMKMCKLRMHDSEFLKKVDENKMLIGCENGVLDMEMGIFRDGRPDDYITLSTGVHYRNYTDDDDEVQEFHDYYKKVFPNAARRNYYWDFMCIAMRGGNINKKFLAQTGVGDNAKSVNTLLVEKTFGEYVIKFPRELLIRGRGNTSGQARPELARVRGKRFAIVQEIADHEEIDIGVLKELTGNDSFFVRNLFEKGFELVPMFTMLLQCNKLPKIPGHDQGDMEPRPRVALRVYVQQERSHRHRRAVCQEPFQGRPRVCIQDSGHCERAVVVPVQPVHAPQDSRASRAEGGYCVDRYLP